MTIKIDPRTGMYVVPELMDMGPVPQPYNFQPSPNPQGSDTVRANLTPGEAVIPAPVAQDPAFKPAIQQMVMEGRDRNAMRMGTTSVPSYMGGTPQVPSYRGGDDDVRPNFFNRVPGGARTLDTEEATDFLSQNPDWSEQYDPETDRVTYAHNEKPLVADAAGNIYKRTGNAVGDFVRDVFNRDEVGVIGVGGAPDRVVSGEGVKVNRASIPELGEGARAPVPPPINDADFIKGIDYGAIPRGRFGTVDPRQMKDDEISYAIQDIQNGTSPLGQYDQELIQQHARQKIFGGRDLHQNADGDFYKNLPDGSVEYVFPQEIDQSGGLNFGGELLQTVDPDQQAVGPLPGGPTPSNVRNVVFGDDQNVPHPTDAYKKNISVGGNDYVVTNTGQVADANGNVLDPAVAGNTINQVIREASVGDPAFASALAATLGVPEPEVGSIHDKFTIPKADNPPVPGTPTDYGAKHPRRDEVNRGERSVESAQFEFDRIKKERDFKVKSLDGTSGPARDRLIESISGDNAQLKAAYDNVNQATRDATILRQEREEALGNRGTNKVLKGSYDKINAANKTLQDPNLPPDVRAKIEAERDSAQADFDKAAGLEETKAAANPGPGSNSGGDGKSPPITKDKNGKPVPGNATNNEGGGSGGGATPNDPANPGDPKSKTIGEKVMGFIKSIGSALSSVGIEPAALAQGAILYAGARAAGYDEDIAGEFAAKQAIGYNQSLIDNKAAPAFTRTGGIQAYTIDGLETTNNTPIAYEVEDSKGNKGWVVDSPLHGGKQVSLAEFKRAANAQDYRIMKGTGPTEAEAAEYRRNFAAELGDLNANQVYRVDKDGKRVRGNEKEATNLAHTGLTSLKKDFGISVRNEASAETARSILNEAFRLRDKDTQGSRKAANSLQPYLKEAMLVAQTGAGSEVFRINPGSSPEDAKYLGAAKVDEVYGKVNELSKAQLKIGKPEGYEAPSYLRNEKNSENVNRLWATFNIEDNKAAIQKIINDFRRPGKGESEFSVFLEAVVADKKLNELEDLK